MKRTTIVDLSTPSDIRKHGNLTNSYINQLRSKHGQGIRECGWGIEHNTGTIVDREGKYWDWWLDDAGNVVSVPSV